MEWCGNHGRAGGGPCPSPVGETRRGEARGGGFLQSVLSRAAKGFLTTTSEFIR